jgi:FkbM family methyltransferase
MPQLVVVDAGVQEGMHHRWHFLGRHLSFHGFDPVVEAIEPLLAKATDGEHYYPFALGERDGEGTIFIPTISRATSLFPRIPAQDQQRMAIHPGNTVSVQQRTTRIRSLDSLLGENAIPAPDAIKIDCEGYEPEIIRGASSALASGNVLAIEVETGFSSSETYPQTHFVAITEQLMPHGFALADLTFDRVPYAAYVSRATTLGRSPRSTVSRPGTFDVLFFRDLTRLVDVTAETVLKQAVIFELYGMNDAAYDLLSFFSHKLTHAVLEAADNLIPRRALLIGSTATIREASAELWYATKRSIAYRSKALAAALGRPRL